MFFLNYFRYECICNEDGGGGGSGVGMKYVGKCKMMMSNEVLQMIMGNTGMEYDPLKFGRIINDSTGG